MPTIALTSLVTPPSGVIVYWALVGISTPGIFLFGLVALLFTAIATFDLLAGRHYARALSASDPRSARTSIRALFGALPLATLLAIILCALAAMLLGFFADLSGVSASTFALAILVAATALLVAIVVQRLRQPRATPWRLFLASVGAALLLVGGVGVLFLLILFSSVQSSFAHATSASYAGQRYHLAREDSLLEHPTWHEGAYDTARCFTAERFPTAYAYRAFCSSPLPPPPSGVLPSGGHNRKRLAALCLPRRSPVAPLLTRLPSRRDDRGG